MLKAHPNITKLYALTALNSLFFFTAFDKIFLAENGLSIIQIVWIGIIFGITVLISEVPSGALSDRWSRKYTLSLSTLSSLVYVSIFAVSTSWIMFAIATVFAALAYTFNSGTNSSILFDSLLEVSETQNYEKYLFVRRLVSSISFMSASVTGGFIANSYNIQTSIFATLPVIFLALTVTFLLKEPSFHKTTGEMTYWKHISHTKSLMMSNKFFIHAALLSIMIMSVNLIIEDYAQLYYAYIGVGIIIIGLLGSVEAAKEIIANYLGSRICMNKENSKLFAVLLFIMSFALLLTSQLNSLWGILFLFISSSIFFIIDVPLMSKFHRKLDSKVRATSESFLNLSTEIIRIIMALGFAGIAQLYSISIGFMFLGIIMGLYAVYYALFSNQEILK